ncbi:MAG TPA: isoleucine--tRNA ligase, partial [Burkholderiales bacterium]
EIRTLGKLLEKGYVYRGLKPVNWCFDCGSALAEAEVEYIDRTDFAIDVGFPLADDQRGKLAQAFALDELPKGPVYAVIWTTTPWTIPANQALNVHPAIVYSLVQTEKGTLILANDLKETCLTRFGLKRIDSANALDHNCPGKNLELIRFKHPFYDRLSPVYLGEYVTLEQGTGIVHSAPAYGVEDFVSCRRYGLKDDQILTPVSGDGKYAVSLEFFGGMDIWQANPKIVDKIREAGALFHSEKHQHSYMHCWRHKTPIIYRASTQWFAAMDEPPGFKGNKPAESLRTTALRGIDATSFFPAWGKARLHGMIANRPDWTLSRQRQWGVPMPFFVHAQSDELHPSTLDLIEQVAQRVEKHGIEAWQTLDAKELLGAEAEQYVKIKDTLDVWFDSGSTHQTVMGGPEGQRTGAGSHGRKLQFPADLYLEGSDQHRGWFHSSLLISCMLNGVPPYKGLLTHGFFVDGEGRKMSKSQGNAIEPQKVAGSLGAEILRLWVAATDYSGELSISDEILKRVVEAYRRIRNTLRFLLANISDFDPKRDAIPVADWVEVDRYAVVLAREVQKSVLEDYDRYEFHTAAAKLQNFCSEDLSAFYLDVLKDRLYTCGKNSPARRSAQNALHHITQCLLRLIAPVLSFTAEEAWKVFQPGDTTIFAHTYYRLPEIPEAQSLLAKWRTLREIRSEAQKLLENHRAAGEIGSSLQAEVEIAASGDKLKLLQGLGDDLRFVLITSRAAVIPVTSASEEAIRTAPSKHAKCERCWHYR